MIKILLDTNIIIHRETNLIQNEDIGQLYYWLDELHYQKCIHPITIVELEKFKDKEVVKTIKVKLESYHLLKSVAPIHEDIYSKILVNDRNEHDKNDTSLLNELINDRVDFLITEDRKILSKATILGINDRVYSIDSFLWKVITENPTQLDYKVLSVKKALFSSVDVKSSFFDSFRLDYKGFDKWFNKKADESAYVTYYKNKIGAFLYLKLEEVNEVYSDIEPIFTPKRRLKIGTFKVALFGLGLGERFLKIIFDNALKLNVQEIYVTMFQNHPGHFMLSLLLEEFGFTKWGMKHSISGEEIVYVRDFSRIVNKLSPRLTFPYIQHQNPVHFVSIYPEYHTELFPDSILKTESPANFIEHEPHRNVIHKVYISHAYERNLNPGDILLFYRTGGYFKGVVTTLGIVESINTSISSSKQLIKVCRNRTVLTDEQLVSFWKYKENIKPFVVNLLYAYSLPNRINLADLIKLGVIQDINSIPRGFGKISWDKFMTVLKYSKSDENIIGY